MKNFALLQNRLKLQMRAEFYNVFNHPNLYVNSASTDVSTNSFTNAAGTFVPGVTASFRDNRQTVLALKMTF